MMPGFKGLNTHLIPAPLLTYIEMWICNYVAYNLTGAMVKSHVLPTPLPSSFPIHSRIIALGPFVVGGLMPTAMKQLALAS